MIEELDKATADRLSLREEGLEDSDRERIHLYSMVLDVDEELRVLWERTRAVAEALTEMYEKHVAPPESGNAMDMFVEVSWHKEGRLLMGWLVVVCDPFALHILSRQVLRVGSHLRLDSDLTYTLSPCAFLLYQPIPRCSTPTSKRWSGSSPAAGASRMTW